ncbi:ribosomal protein bL36 [Microbacterium halotolerans]|uniref:ribosomal protein bL36 n=1 Tax=Microbacterium halotolerans TaxID=246613 RepID=UPI000E6AC45A|nr:ribosomal protein bL36 [Microbacterium halotolerans]
MENTGEVERVDEIDVPYAVAQVGKGSEIVRRTAGPAANSVPVMHASSSARVYVINKQNPRFKGRQG